MSELAAVTAEASEPEPFYWSFGGKDFVLPAKPDIRAFALLTKPERIFDGLRILFGREQWEQVIESDDVLDDERFAQLLHDYTAHIGVDLGEWSASTRS